MLSLMTAVEPAIHSEGVMIGRTLLSFHPSQLKATVEKIAVTDDAMKHSWGDAVYRLKLNSAGPVETATWKMELSAK